MRMRISLSEQCFEQESQVIDPADGNSHLRSFFDPISTGLFYLVVALGGGGGSTPFIKFDPDILKH